MHEVIRAFLKAFRSQLHPKMLILAAFPFFGSLILWGGLLWWYWDPLTSWLRDTLLQWSGFSWFDSALIAWGLMGLKTILVPLLVVLGVFPLTFITAIILVGTLAMPIILQYLCQGPGEYSDLVEQGESIFSQSLANTIIGVLIFGLGWLLTLPLWLIPPMAFILPFFWVTYLNVRLLRVDTLVQHASHSELDSILKQHQGRLWLLGMLVTLLCTLPLMWLVAPVFSGLAFAHYQLTVLRTLRANRLEKTI